MLFGVSGLFIIIIIIHLDLDTWIGPDRSLENSYKPAGTEVLPFNNNNNNRRLVTLVAFYLALLLLVQR